MKIRLNKMRLHPGKGQAGLTKKLAHRRHGPFSVKRKVDEYPYELELPDRNGYRFYPVVHVSRMKPVSEMNNRPTTRLVPEFAEESRLHLDEKLLPEDSWELHLEQHIPGEQTQNATAIMHILLYLINATEMVYEKNVFKPTKIQLHQLAGAWT
ncbi:hypothetical protein PHMEG_000907 [Phytophthora megakarya]|uniref:Tf2-1-like SH3-like domain-containing protein n=1 Tax=Phytophthora megakarya TaxID=4795 RepID=A0A225X439_9STRA|nr:hypothetical protein PHMEG_000907 [Phytophthora megakarya]